MQDASTRAVAANRSTGAMLDHFRRYFDVVPADTPDRMREALAIRYSVYCVERGFENSAEHPDGLERDEYDSHAIHSLLIHRSSGTAIGTVRLVLPLVSSPEQSFAIQRVVAPRALKAAFPVATTGEVSRFSLSKQIRRRRDDQLYGPEETVSSDSTARPDEQRQSPPPRLGLLLAIVQMSARLGLTHWCAVMEPPLLRILSAAGVHFEPIGPLVDYHGLRQPCYGEIVQVLPRIRREQPEVWNLITEAGKWWDILLENQRKSKAPATLAAVPHAHGA
jgi:N-acyl amino acid synthase of PEP-CTERM/exosortase system